MSVTTKAGCMCVDRTPAKSVILRFLSTFSNAGNVVFGPAADADETGFRMSSQLVGEVDNGWFCAFGHALVLQKRLVVSAAS